jgi:CubicO group peptidase (beta-lactamase class C family)
MMLDEGNANGQQIVPADWVAESTTGSAPPSASPTDKLGYGYQWWVPADPDGEFFAIGIYGQYIYVNRPTRTVIVKTSVHRDFDNDGVGGRLVEQENIEVFRAIVTGLSG